MKIFTQLWKFVLICGDLMEFLWNMHLVVELCAHLWNLGWDFVENLMDVLGTFALSSGSNFRSRRKNPGYLWNFALSCGSLYSFVEV